MGSTKAAARSAGFLYMLSGIPALFSYLYLPAVIVVPGNAAATAQRITDSTATYRIGILGDLVSQLLLVLVVLSLYDLLSDADRRQARLMVTLVVVGVAFQAANVLNLMAPLLLLNGADFLSVFTKPQLDALALGFLRLRSEALFVSQLFWGLWLFPFGVLVMKSGLFPKILGILLIAACFGYVAGSVAVILEPLHARPVVQVGQVLGGLGEGSMMFWLAIKGANFSARGTQAS
jgi:hypothetical protein